MNYIDTVRAVESGHERTVNLEKAAALPYSAQADGDDHSKKEARLLLVVTPLSGQPDGSATISEMPSSALQTRTYPASAGESDHSRQVSQSHVVALNSSATAGDLTIERQTPETGKSDHEISPPSDDGCQGIGDFQERNAAVKNTASDGGSGEVPLLDSAPEVASTSPHKSRKGKVGADQGSAEPLEAIERPDLRFIDPLVAEIVQLHRMRRRWMKARNSLILQCKAFGRSLSDGDLDLGNAAYERVVTGKMKPGDEVLAMAMVPFVPAIERFDEEMKPIERQLEKLAKRLPVAAWVKSVKGLGWGSLAAIVGEAGDLSQYPTVSGVWKRMGLAVIDGDGRQRKCADADKAAVHGYNPERRAVVWNMADSLSKHQRTWLNKETGEIRKPADHYGEILEREKAKALAAELTPLHAENRAKRHMSKVILRDLTIEWRRAVGQAPREIQADDADRTPILEAAE